jgi:hypothetical protein
LDYFREVLLKDQPEFLPGFELSHFCGNLIAQARVGNVFDKVFEARD